MYNFEEFITKVRLELEQSLKHQYGNVEVQEIRMKKVNCEMVGLTFHFLDNEDTLSPNIYLESFYERYMEQGDFDDILRRIELVLAEVLEERNYLKEKAKGITKSTDNIIFQLIHTKQNEELLKDLPHRSFFNLSIIYRSVLEISENSILSAPITQPLAALMGLSEEQLYRLAYENTKRIMEPSIVPMHEVIQSLIGDEVPIESLFDETNEQHISLYVISNSSRNWGASSVLYLDDLQAFADKLESNLYLIPSSVHEMIIFETDQGEPEAWADMVYEINQTVSVEERLSNDIYMYDREKNEIVQVTNSEHKMIFEKKNESVENDEMDEGSTSMQMGM